MALIIKTKNHSKSIVCTCISPSLWSFNAFGHCIVGAFSVFFFREYQCNFSVTASSYSSGARASGAADEKELLQPPVRELP